MNAKKEQPARPVRVRRHPAWHAIVLSDGRVIEPGQETDAISPEEARSRPDFLIEETPE